MKDHVAINLNIPVSLNQVYQQQADARLTSKSAVLREVLLNHVRSAGATEMLSAPKRRKRAKAAA